MIAFCLANLFVFYYVPVLSAVGGIKQSANFLTQGIPAIKEHLIVQQRKSHPCHYVMLAYYLTHFISSTGQIAGIAIGTLIALFLVQRLGTDKVGYTFGPVILTWFILIAGIGIYNVIKYDTGILKAFNPKYIIDYFQRNGKEGWISLGGVVLCITGIFIP